jgi:lipopolysaccharide transport system ATP-binding protein
MEAQSDVLREKEFWALEDISFELKRGECLGVIGPNGAGKSTLLKLLNGIISPDKGRLMTRGRVGALIQVGAGFHPNLTGRENIYVNGQILGIRRSLIINLMPLSISPTSAIFLIPLSSFIPAACLCALVSP